MLLCPLVASTCLTARAETEPERVDARTRATLPTTTASVPMDSLGRRPVVEALINGKGQFRLILDTGTSFGVVLDDAVIRKLGRSMKESVQALGGGNLDLVEAGTLAIGDAVFSQVKGIRSDVGGRVGDQEIVGILGSPLFRECLLTLDFVERRVRFESGQLPWPDGDTVEYSTDQEHDYGVTVAFSVAGVSVKAHLDTGSPAFVTLLNKFQKKLPLKEQPQVVGIARTPQGEAEIRSAVLDGVLKLGRHEWAKPRIDFADLVPMLHFDAGNIGSRLLREDAVTVDQNNHRVRFRRSRDGGR